MGGGRTRGRDRRRPSALTGDGEAKRKRCRSSEAKQTVSYRKGSRKRRATGCAPRFGTVPGAVAAALPESLSRPRAFALKLTPKKVKQLRRARAARNVLRASRATDAALGSRAAPIAQAASASGSSARTSSHQRLGLEDGRRAAGHEVDRQGHRHRLARQRAEERARAQGRGRHEEHAPARLGLERAQARRVQVPDGPLPRRRRPRPRDRLAPAERHADGEHRRRRPRGHDDDRPVRRGPQPLDPNSSDGRLIDDGANRSGQIRASGTASIATFMQCCDVATGSSCTGTDAAQADRDVTIEVTLPKAGGPARVQWSFNQDPSAGTGGENHGTCVTPRLPRPLRDTARRVRTVPRAIFESDGPSSLSLDVTLDLTDDRGGTVHATEHYALTIQRVAGG